MRAVLVATVALAACGREPESPASRPPAPPAPAADRSDRPIAFVRSGNLWVMKADGTDARALTELKDASVASPAWRPDRRALAFTARVDPEFQLTPRNVFVVGADGTGLRQVTPMPRAGRRLDDAPKGMVRGRAFRIVDGQRVPAPELRVTAYGTHQTSVTGADGAFQIFLPVGGGWIRIAGTIDDRRWNAFRFTAVTEGTTTLLGDLSVTSGGDDEPALPAWTSDGRSIGYLLRHSLINRLQFGGTVSLHRIGEDGAGDQAIAEPTGPSIVAGPVFQGQTAWLKTSDGRILRIDLDTRGVSASIDVGIGVPDALALSPDGASLATLRLEGPGRMGVVLVRDGKARTLATLAESEGVPHAIAFSPDGEKLLLDRQEGPRSDLWTLWIATGAWTRLTSDGGSSDPVWHGR